MHVTCYSPSKKCRLFLSPRAKEPVLIYHLGAECEGKRERSEDQSSFKGQGRNLGKKRDRALNSEIFRANFCA